MKPWLLALALTLTAVTATAAEPFADIHLHYKWNQQPVTSPAQALQILRDQDIELAVVTGTPAELALTLADADPQRIIPIYGVYRVAGDWSRWYLDSALPDRVRAALAGGRYRGIGELHMIGGFIPRHDTPVIRQLFELAAEFDVPVLAHVEFARANYLIDLCQAYPATRIQLAHAGGPMPASEVVRALAACPNLWVELSARDPWRYLRTPIADEHNRLLPEWRELVLAHADRILTGSDPVWPIDQIDAWDKDDTGWQELPRFLQFHRDWLAALPAEVAEKIRWHNARELYRLP